MPAYRGPDGKIVYASDEDAGRFEAGGYERVGEAAAGAAQNRVAPVDNGITGSIGATIGAGLSGATLGASDWLLKGVLDKGQFEQYAQDRADNPGLAGAAQFAGAFLPAVVSGGTATPSGYLSHLAAEGIGSAEAVGGAAGAAKSLAIAGSEGAIQNAGVYLSDVALGDRDLTAEGMVGALGTGFAFGSGGLVAMHGVVGGTVAARRMFARYAAGGEEAAQAARSAWQEQSAKALESFDQTASAAQARLQEAQLARQQADLARKQASAAVADAKIARPVEAAAGETPAAAAPGQPPTDTELAGLMRDRAMAATGPQRMAAWDAQNGPKLQELLAARGPNVEVGTGELSSPTNTAIGRRTDDLNGLMSQLKAMSAPEEVELTSKLREYQRARGAFDETHARVDPDLDEVMRGMRAPDVGQPGGAIGDRSVPVGEFGAPGARGYNPGEVSAPGPPSQAPLEQAAEGTPVTRAMRKGAPVDDGAAIGKRGAPSTTTPFDFKDSGLTFDPGTRQYASAEAPGAISSEFRAPKVNADSDGFSPLHGNGEFRALSEDEFESLQKSYKNELSADERGDAQMYAGGSRFRELNGAARQGSVHAANAEAAGKLDALIAKSPTDRPIQVARVVGMEDGSSEARKLWADLKPGDVVTDRAWQSTTANYEYANSLGDTVLIIDVPKGYPAAPMPGPHNEWELVLRRDTSYRVKGIHEADGKLFAHVEVVPTEAPPPPLKVLERGERTPNGPPVSVTRAGGSQGATSAKETPAGTFRPISDDEYTAQREAYGSRLSPDEAKALDVYTSSTYKDINRQLRHGEIRNGRERFIAKLDDAIAKSSLHDNAVMYRGLSGDEAKQFRNLEVGDRFEEKAFVSTSSSPTAFKRDINLHIDVPAGYQAAPIPSTIDEKEWLLRRNTRFVVTGIEDNGGARNIRVRVESSSPPRPVSEMVSSSTGRLPDAPPIEIVKSARATHMEPGGGDLLSALQGTSKALGEGKSIGEIGASSPARAEYVSQKVARRAEDAAYFRAKAKGTPATEPESDLEAQLRGTKEQLGAGKSMRDISGAPMVSDRAVAMKKLEMAHDDALERAASAKEPAERAAAQSEAKAIEQQMTVVGKKPGAVEDIATLAPVVHRLEKAATELTEALGETAPAAAKEHAAAFRRAEDAADQKSMARAARAADDHASARERVQADDLVAGPSAKERAVAAAKRQRAEAEAAYQKARVSEAEASIGARQTQRAADEARANMPGPPVSSGPARKGAAGRLVAGAHAVGYAAELGSDLGVPGIPRPHDIPVIGPLLSAYLKYRAFRAAAGRFAGRIPVTAETRAAELAARTRDGIARSMDRSLGLIERNPNAVRGALTIGAVVATNALSKRLVDDGHPDAPAGASASQQAAVRMREVAAVMANPSLVTNMVRQQTSGVMDPELIQALENHLMSVFQHLNDTAPKGPPPNPLTKQEWKPPQAAAMQWGQRVAVASNPQVAFDMLEAGKLTPAPADTLRICYQKLFAEGQRQLAQRAADLKNPVPYRQVMQVGLLFDIATHPSLDPENATVMQQIHTPPAPPMPQQPTAPPTSAVAAPTNVNALYQTSADRRAAR